MLYRAKHLILIAGLLVAGGYARSETGPIAATPEETVRELFALLHLDEINSRVWREALATGQLETHSQRALELCSPRELSERLVPIYLKLFSQEELQELIAALQTEDGEHFTNLVGRFANSGASAEAMGDQLTAQDLESLNRLFEVPAVATLVERLPQTLVDGKGIALEFARLCLLRASDGE